MGKPNEYTQPVKGAYGKLLGQDRKPTCAELKSPPRKDPAHTMLGGRASALQEERKPQFTEEAPPRAEVRPPKEPARLPSTASQPVHSGSGR